jgi:hypothetical protein
MLSIGERWRNEKCKGNKKKECRQQIDKTEKERKKERKKEEEEEEEEDEKERERKRGREVLEQEG